MTVAPDAVFLKEAPFTTDASQRSRAWHVIEELELWHDAFTISVFSEPAMMLDALDAVRTAFWQLPDSEMSPELPDVAFSEVAFMPDMLMSPAEKDNAVSLSTFAFFILMSPDDDEDASMIVATTLEQPMSPAELVLNLAAFLAMALEIFTSPAELAIAETEFALIFSTSMSPAELEVSLHSVQSMFFAFMSPAELTIICMVELFVRSVMILISPAELVRNVLTDGADILSFGVFFELRIWVLSL